MSATTEEQRAEIDRINGEIQKHWPEKWAKAALSTKPAKKRSQLRKWWRESEELRVLKVREPDARCETCDSYAPMPNDSRGRMICEAESDYYGYQVTSATALCLKWRRA